MEYTSEVETLDGTKAVIHKTIAHILRKFSLPNMTVEVLVTDDAHIKEINRQFRKIDRSTDVLSFPNLEGEIKQSEIEGGYLGSLVISFQRAVKQAEEYGHGVIREVAFLTTHGMLHLLGYDHVEPGEEKEMVLLANEILNELEILR